jgi:hypothetical protein
MARPKKIVTEERENETMQLLQNLNPETPQARYLIELISIMKIMGRSMDEIADEIMIYFGETLQIGIPPNGKK